MADTDKSQKTEKPTGRRKSEARKQGQVAKSQEVAVAVSLLGTALLLRQFLPGIADSFAGHTRAIFTGADQGLASTELRGHALGMLAAGIAPFAIAATSIAVVTNIAQVGFRVTPSLAKPKLKNLSLKRGLERMKPGQQIYEMFKSVAKLALLAAVAWGPVQEWKGHLDERQGLDEALGSTLAVAGTILLRAGLLSFLIAAIDFARNLRKHRMQLKMTKQEVKEEAKSTDGNPLIKGKRRQFARELSRNRMLKSVATADVVIVNPTHVAVALKYEAGDAAPRVVAKGVNTMALKIKKLAYRHGVMVREDPPLARSLYRSTKVGHLIPTALYEAVAAVIAAAYRRRGRRAA
jgi:flagellar biosynthesis protein FlhB